MRGGASQPGRVMIDGMSYPVTGYWCPLCGLPRLPEPGWDVHPDCYYHRGPGEA